MLDPGRDGVTMHPLAQCLSAGRQMTLSQIGFFAGAFFACACLTGLLEWMSRDWPRSLTRLLFINLFSFLLASWLYAHGTAISAAQSLVNISTLHAYFWPQVVILVAGIVIFWGRKRPEVEEDILVVRKEPTF